MYDINENIQAIYCRPNNYTLLTPSFNNAPFLGHWPWKNST
jgi:hypothetical protein